MMKIFNRKQKEKAITYANEQERLKIRERLVKQQDKLNKKIEKYSSNYIVLAKRRQDTNRGSVKRILKLSKKIQRDKTKLQHIAYDLNLIAEERYVKESPYARFKKWFSKIPYNKQKVIWGLIFITPWLLGFFLFFFPPLLRSLWWSFNEVKPEGTKITQVFVGFANYKDLFQNYVIDGNLIFNVQLMLFVQNLAIDLPIIIIFSLFIAVLLNKEFKGHQIVKAIFFIPVIYNITVITATMSRGFGLHLEQNSMADVLLTQQLSGFLMEVGVGTSFINIVIAAVARIFTIVNYSGIQILIFITALQSIPNQLFEAARVEGATKYEMFWKITIPMVTPMILTGAIYTVIDSFARAPIFRFLVYAQVQSRYGLASAIAMAYFAINLALILVVYIVMKGVVFYYDE